MSFPEATRKGRFGIPIAVHHVRKMRGCAQGHLVLADDRRHYVVKTVDNPQHKRVLMNEWLASSLAVRLGLPVPAFCAVEISRDFIEAHPNFVASVKEACILPYRPGLAFGSRLIDSALREGIVDYLPPSLLLTVVNREQFLGALILDKWTCNSDGRQAVFQFLEAPKSTAYFIDFGNCFNEQHWTMKDAPLRGKYGLDAVYSSVKGLRDFNPWLETVQRISEDDFWADIYAAPAEWYQDDREPLSNLVKLMIKRRDCIAELILSMRTAKPSIFPAWPD